jgi:hypothetical protein
MLTQQEAENLSERMEQLSCSDQKAGAGLFGFVLGGEIGDQKSAYERHMAECEYCRTALQIYRYKRDAMKLTSKWEKAKQVVSLSETPGSRVLKRQLGHVTAYFQPGDAEGRGTTVVVDSSGDFLSVEEQCLDEFQRLKDTGT